MSLALLGNYDACFGCFTQAGGPAVAVEDHATQLSAAVQQDRTESNQSPSQKTALEILYEAIEVETQLKVRRDNS